MSEEVADQFYFPQKQSNWSNIRLAVQDSSHCVGGNSFYQFIILFSWEGSRQTENRKSRFMNFSAFLALKELEKTGRGEGGNWTICWWGACGSNSYQLTTFQLIQISHFQIKSCCMVGPKYWYILAPHNLYGDTTQSPWSMVRVIQRQWSWSSIILNDRKLSSLNGVKYSKIILNYMKWSLRFREISRFWMILRDSWIFLKILR